VCIAQEDQILILSTLLSLTRVMNPLRCVLFVQDTILSIKRFSYSLLTLKKRGRINQLKSLGHSVDKVEYIVMGGTFMSLGEDYRNWFIQNLHVFIFFFSNSL
jgi:hypothetical protein